jgi:hypothetical protein
MPDEKGEKRLLAMLDKTMDKMERHQRADGSWGQDGWAPIVGQSLASTALNRAKQQGVRVSDKTLEKADKYARSNFDAKNRKFTEAGTAGVPLYGAANNLAAGQQTVNTLAQAKPDLKKIADSPTATKGEKDKAQKELGRIAKVEADQDAALQATTEQIKDKRFIQGFGSNGGEEFLSYMNIGETLVVKGGKEWEKWDKSMTDNMNRIQNKDGSWSGHHCITGRTFCTASALMVLMADRAPVPIAAKVQGKK